MSYKDAVVRINKKYDDVIDDIKKTQDKYQEAIDILNKMKNVDDCSNLKASILSKKSELDDKIEDIKRIKEHLLEEAKKEDKKKEEEKE